MRKLRVLLKDQSGSTTPMFIAWAFTLILVVCLLMEMGAAHEHYDYAMDVLQRATNSAVEANIIDAYRSDRLLVLDTTAAETDFLAMVDQDLLSSGSYRVEVDSVECSTTPPALTATGHGTFPTLFSHVGFPDVPFSFRITSTNYDLDG